MKILFVMPIVDVGYPNQIGALSAFLKQYGHSTDYLELLYYSEIKDSHLAKIRLKIEDFNPDLIGFSSYEMTFSQIARCSNFIKKYYNIPIIVGGYYATLAPDDVLDCESVDIICRGEGEYPLLELMESLLYGKDYTHICNLWIKQKGRIIKNKIRPLIENLDSLPFPDRSLTYSASTNNELEIMTSRGCPFNCYYCANHTLKELYPNKEIYLRHRSVSNVILEIKECLKKGNYTTIRFKDETFTSDKKWLEEFCREYQRNVSLPFISNVYPTTGSLEILKLLKKSGCTLIQVGIESGDEVIRKKILNRKIANSKLIEVFRNARKIGLKVKSYNIFGIPFETRSSRLKTIALNIRLRPYIVQTNFYYPFKGTRLGDQCYQGDWIDTGRKGRISFLSNDSVLKMPRIKRAEIKITKWLNSGTAIFSGNYHLVGLALKLAFQVLKRRIQIIKKKSSYSVRS